MKKKKKQKKMQYDIVKALLGIYLRIWLKEIQEGKARILTWSKLN